MKIKNEKIAVFGGTFDPPHNGHIGIALEVLNSNSAGKVVFVPAFHPPHKPDFPVTDFKRRLEMLEIATSADSRFEISDMEARRSGPSFTYDTLVEFEKINPDSEIKLLIGSDSLAFLHTWYMAAEIVGRWPLIVYPRRGCMPSMDELSANWGTEVAEKLCGYILRMRCFELSSTEIRKKLAEGGDVSALIDRGVCRYIMNNRIYWK